MAFGLGLGLGLGSRTSVSPGVLSNPLCDAIAKKHSVSFTHNRANLVAAPHAVYKRGDKSLFLDAVVVSRNGNPVADGPMRTFDTTKLTAIAGTTTSFMRQARFDPTARKYRNKICIVEI